MEGCDSPLCMKVEVTAKNLVEQGQEVEVIDEETKREVESCGHFKKCLHRNDKCGKQIPQARTQEPRAPAGFQAVKETGIEGTC